MRHCTAFAVAAVLIASVYTLVSAQEEPAGGAIIIGEPGGVARAPAGWEYKVVTSDGNDREIEAALNEAGVAGWELVAAAGRDRGMSCVLKRPKR